MIPSEAVQGWRAPQPRKNAEKRRTELKSDSTHPIISCGWLKDYSVHDEYGEENHMLERKLKDSCTLRSPPSNDCKFCEDRKNSVWRPAGMIRRVDDDGRKKEGCYYGKEVGAQGSVREL